MKTSRTPVVAPPVPFRHLDLVAPPPPAVPELTQKKRTAATIAKCISIVAAFSVGLVGAVSSHFAFGWGWPICIVVGIGGLFSEGAVFWSHVQKGLKSLVNNPFKDKEIFYRKVNRDGRWILEKIPPRERAIKTGFLILLMLISVGVAVGFTAIGLSSFVEVFGPHWISYVFAGITGVMGGMAQGLLMYAELSGYLKNNIFKKMAGDFKLKKPWNTLSREEKASHILYVVSLGIGTVIIMGVSVLMALGVATAWSNAGAEVYRSSLFSRAIMWGAVIPAAILFSFKHSRKTVKMFLGLIGKLAHIVWHPKKTWKRIKKFTQTVKESPAGAVGLFVVGLLSLGGLIAHVFAEGAVAGQGAKTPGTFANRVFTKVLALLNWKMSPAHLAVACRSISEGFTDAPFAIKQSKNLVDTCCNTSAFFPKKKPQSLVVPSTEKYFPVNPLASRPAL